MYRVSHVGVHISFLNNFCMRGYFLMQFWLSREKRWEITVLKDEWDWKNISWLLSLKTAKTKKEYQIHCVVPNIPQNNGIIELITIITAILIYEITYLIVLQHITTIYSPQIPLFTIQSISLFLKSSIAANRISVRDLGEGDTDSVLELLHCGHGNGVDLSIHIFPLDKAQGQNQIRLHLNPRTEMRLAAILDFRKWLMDCIVNNGICGE